MAANRQTDIHTHAYAQCSHASVGLAQARPNYVDPKWKQKHSAKSRLMVPLTRKSLSTLLVVQSQQSWLCYIAVSVLNKIALRHTSVAH